MSAVENAGRVQGRRGWRRGFVGALLALGLGIGAALAPTASFAATQPDPQDSRAVYRFWSSKFANAHFYTVSTSEAQGLYSGDPNWTYEGTDFRVWPVSGGSCQANTVSVHRFWSSAFASHFYTTNGAEAEKVRTTDKNWKYEGVAFCTAKQGAAGTVPVHRFWSPKFKKHFYTANATEAQNLRTSDKNWTYEGVAIYAPASGPASPALTGPTAPKPTTPPVKLTTAQQNAVDKAKSYLEFTAFSRAELIDQLEYEGFSTADATFGVDYLAIDWRKQALASAESYLETFAFSKAELIGQLEYEEFTAAEVTYAISTVKADWNAEALEQAESYLDSGDFSEAGLADQLAWEEFTTAQIDYAMSAVTADWNAEAAESAKSYMKYGSFSREQLYDQLEYEGFTASQIEYGLKSVGY